MIRDYKFKDIENYLRKDSNVGKDVIEAFSSLADAAIIFTPIVFGPQFLPLLSLLDVKDRLVELGKKVYNCIVQRIEPDYIHRADQIRAAYALICYTSYFETLQSGLPKNIREKLKQTFEKKKELIEENTETVSNDIHCNMFYADHVTSFSEIKEQLILVYEQITNGLIKVVDESEIFNPERKQEKQQLETLKKKLEKLPEQAIQVYEAQYLQLADQFSDFAFFAQMENFEGLHHAIKENKSALSQLAEITDKIDVGLSNLNSVVQAIATNNTAKQVQDIVKDLKNKYESIINETIIDAKEIKADTETISLQFPKIVDAFIPQSYKCMSYNNKETHLEDEKIWEKLEIQHDINKFFVKYLYSPDNIEYPLIILGHPGSGKSLLTKVLSAQLTSKSYTVIRIPLREVKADSDIDVLVEDQIKKLTNRSISSQGYGEFASQFKEKPLIIILDGYDELLQAKGDVFSNYLMKVRSFQQDQRSMNRPVRIIITSRITLIDKARIPENSTIVRLMEFDKEQRQTWINIWNKINADYFKKNNIQKFSLPFDDNKKKSSIIELAEQPLLLLMLAIYDSEANELAQTSNIKRTELYDNLLRRFIRRERGRYVPGFSDKSVQEQEEIIDQEMNRLGVVAIGMYNRQKVVIHSRQLENDLSLFEARRTDGSPKAHTLKESESVLGGFFFIHKSTAQDIDAHSDNSESAYEFLHNTFGEFLAADFILRNTINEVKDLLILRKYKLSGLENKLSNPDSYNPGWFYCLMFVPLYSRPVVIEMLREHAEKALQRLSGTYDNSINISYDEFIENLKCITQNHLKMILNSRKSPDVMRKGILCDRDIPLLGYLSTYSLNLIILVSTLSRNGYKFDEADYRNPETKELDSKPWDKLASLWKTWFAPADLSGLSVILKATRKDDNTVQISCNEKFEATHYENPIDILLCISSTLADNLLTGLSGLQSRYFEGITKMSYQNISDMLSEEYTDLYFAYLVKILSKEINCVDNGLGITEEFRDHINYIDEIINKILNTITNFDQIVDINIYSTLFVFLLALESALQKKIIFASTKRLLARVLPILIENFNSRSDYIDIVYRLLCLINETNRDLLIFNSRDILEMSFYRDIFTTPDFRVNERIRFVTRRSAKISNMPIYLFNNYGSFQLSLRQSIENANMLDKIDNTNVLEAILLHDNIDILVQTNPELLSHIIQIQLSNNKIIPSHYIEMFLVKCFHQFMKVGASYFGYNALINVINIAKLVKNDVFLYQIQKILERQLFERSEESLISIVYLYPSFVADLIGVLPDIFTENLPYVSNIMLRLRKTVIEDYFLPDRLLDYIQMYRALSELSSMVLADKQILDGIILLAKTILKSSYLEKIYLSRLNINQFKNLIWLINNVNDSNISSDLRKIISIKLDNYDLLMHS